MTTATAKRSDETPPRPAWWNNTSRMIQLRRSTWTTSRPAEASPAEIASARVMRTAGTRRSSARWVLRSFSWDLLSIWNVSIQGQHLLGRDHTEPDGMTYEFSAV